MIESATYSDGKRTATLSVQRIDTWQEDTEVILNFPHVMELADDCLFMRFARSQHAIAEVEPHRDVYSTDDGKTWGEAPPGMEFGGGSLGYLRDGTIMRLEHNTVEATQRTWDKYVGPFHLVMQEDDPTFRLRTWRSNGEPIDSIEFKIAGLPWETASYRPTPRSWTSTTAACSPPWKPRSAHRGRPTTSEPTAGPAGRSP